MITLKELCEGSGASRRAIQGYEKMGLIKRKGKNKMGYVLYDPSTVAEAHKIKMWQEVGFSLEEIQELRQMQPEEKIEIYREKIQEYSKKQEYLESCIKQLIAKDAMKEKD